MAKRKTNNTDILLYGALGIASGFAINYIQNFFLWYIFRKQSWDLYNKGVAQYGKAFEFWWAVQKIDIDANNGNLSEEEVQQITNDLTNDPYFEKVSAKEVLEAEEWYKKECKWINKPSYFRQRYAYSNYALVIGGLLPLITSIKSKTLKYILYGGAITGLYNAVRYNYNKFNIFELQKSNKIYNDLLKVINKKMAVDYNNSDLKAYSGYILWSIFDLSKQQKEN
jgi:hypothetical protein